MRIIPSVPAFFVLFGTGIINHHSGQTTIIPKPELRKKWGG